MENNSLTYKDKSAALYLMKKTVCFSISGALRVAAKLNIADLLREGPKHINELAKQTNALPALLNRVLRILASENIFYESEHQYYSLAPAGRFLLNDHQYSLRDTVMTFTNETFWLPVGNAIDSVQGEPAFEKLYGMSFYQYWQDNVREDHDFQSGMSALSRLESQFVINQYPFPDNKVVTDIAGGLGVVLLEILKSNPTLKGQLFDREHVLERTCLTELNDDSRWELITGDLFGEFPQSDFYIFKFILHNWDDDDVVRFLKNCRKAMKPDSKIIIIESIIYKKNTPDTAKFIDILCMSVFSGSGDRTEEEIALLLDRAGLRINQCIKTQSYNSILEVVIK